MTPEYRRLIEASTFVALATVGSRGVDCSPRGDQPAAVHVVDERTIHIPDRRGNNRLDSLRNVVEDGRVGFLWLIPGMDECMRVNGRADLWDPDRHVDSGSLPTPGQIMSAITDGKFDGQAYDAALRERQARTLY